MPPNTQLSTPPAAKRAAPVLPASAARGRGECPGQSGAGMVPMFLGTVPKVGK